MGRLSAHKHQDRSETCGRDASAQLKRLTRAELIRLISKLEGQVSKEPPDGCRTEACPGHAPILLVNGSVRSGQTLLFREGDVVVVGSVGSGAEIAAGGSIHVYGALRGRAYAGTAGGTGARIFCQRLEAELLDIGGLSRQSDDLDSELLGRPAHAWRELNHIGLAPLANALEQVHAPTEPASPSVAPPSIVWLSWARRLLRGSPASRRAA